MARTPIECVLKQEGRAGCCVCPYSYPSQFDLVNFSNAFSGFDFGLAHRPGMLDNLNTPKTSEHVEADASVELKRRNES
jgi:hypothetical protein